MNTSTIPEFAAAELSYRRSRIVAAHGPAASGRPAHRRWHRPTRSQHAA